MSNLEVAIGCLVEARASSRYKVWERRSCPPRSKRRKRSRSDEDEDEEVQVSSPATDLHLHEEARCCNENGQCTISHVRNFTKSAVTF